MAFQTTDFFDLLQTTLIIMPLAKKETPFEHKTSNKYNFYVLLGVIIMFFVQFTPNLFGDSLDSAKNSEGTDFWVCFQKNYRDEGVQIINGVHREPLLLQLFLTSDFNAKVKVEIDGIKYSQDVEVKAGTVVALKIDTAAQIRSFGKIERLAIHVTSDVPIGVFGLNRRVQTTDSYLALPVSVLGYEYRVMCYEKLDNNLTAEISIIATEDNTNVEFIPRVLTTTGNQPNMPVKIVLQRGDVIQYAAQFNPATNSDLTGSIVKANKKIAVFGGHICAYVPASTQTCNHLVEQMPPLNAWGKHFYVGTLATRSRSTFRVLANEPNTKVFENFQLIATLNQGEWYENSNQRKNTQITADKPVLVAQYSQGFKNGDSIGDPMMILISPTQQFLNKYRFATPVNGSWKHYINVVVPRESISSMKLNGVTINPDWFATFGSSRYAIAQLIIPFGTHLVQGDKPFGLYSYGFGFGMDGCDAYGNMGGQSFEKYEEKRDTIPPTAEGSQTADAYKIMVRDDGVDDKGLHEIKLISTEGFELNLPKYVVDGTPQVEFMAKIKKGDTFGKAVIEATDLAVNKSIFTVCYQMDNETRNLIYTISPGSSAVCKPDILWYYGAFVHLDRNSHSGGFASTGDVKSDGNFNGNFGDVTASVSYVGAFLAARFTPTLGASARLSVDSYKGMLTAPNDSTELTFIGGKYVSAQAGRTIELENTYLGATFTGEYYLSRNYYGFAGLKMSIALTKSVLSKNVWITPVNTAVPPPKDVIVDGSLSSVSTIVFGGVVGLGASFPVWKKVSAFGELMYTNNFSSLLSDASWKLSQITLNIGAKIRL